MSWNGAPGALFASVASPRATVDDPGARFGDTLRVTVAAFDAAGNRGPLSPPSQIVRFVAATADRPPAFAPVADQLLVEGQSKVVAVSASDPDGDSVTLGALALPAFASFTDLGDGSGALALSPGFGDQGVYGLWIAAISGADPQQTASLPVTLAVATANRPPELAPIGDQRVAVGETLVLEISATDPDGHALVFAASDLPASATFSDAGNGTASLVVQPSPGDVGGHEVTVGVVDVAVPSLRDTETFHLEVAADNEAPELATVRNQQLDEGEARDVPVVAVDPDGDPLRLTAPVLPAFASFSDAGDGTGVLRLAPGPDDTGNHPLILRAEDDGSPPLADQELVVVTVGDVNAPPELDPLEDGIAVGAGALGLVNVSASDPDGDPLFFGASGLPAFATLTDAGDGSAVLELAPQVGDAGTWPITLTVREVGPGLFDTHVLVVTVPDANAPPELSPIADPVVREGETLAVAVTATDPDGGPLQMGALLLPPFASFVDAGDGTGVLTLAPDPGDAGEHRAAIAVADEGGRIDVQTFVIRVLPAL